MISLHGRSPELLPVSETSWEIWRHMTADSNTVVQLRMTRSGVPFERGGPASEHMNKVAVTHMKVCPLRNLALAW